MQNLLKFLLQSVAKSLCHVARFRAVGLIGGIKRVCSYCKWFFQGVCLYEGSLLDSAEVYSRCTEEASRCSHCNTRFFAEVQKRRFVSL